MLKYKGLADYLSLVSNRHNLDLCINDFAGFLRIDEQLYSVLQPYLIHKNAFCLQIKSNRTLWDRCLRMKRGMLLKSERTGKAFYGMCYCGMGEFIVPIICRGVVIGVICAGEFCSRPDIAEYRIGKVAAEHGMDAVDLKEKFVQSTRTTLPALDEMESLLGVVAEYLSQTYEALVSTHEELNLERSGKHSSETYILSHALEYIRQHYTDRVTVTDIAAFCHCSESYVNHIFKKNMRVNIKAYINKIRIEHAKVFLLNSGKNMAEIAAETGFNDPNYFSCVFSRAVGVSPSDFRERFQGR